MAWLHAMTTGAGTIAPATRIPARAASGRRYCKSPAPRALVPRAFVHAPVRHFNLSPGRWARHRIESNVVHGLTWQSAWWALATTYEGYRMPLTWLSRLLDVTLFGLRRGPSRHQCRHPSRERHSALFIVLAHDGPGARSWCVAGLFALHPLRRIGGVDRRAKGYARRSRFSPRSLGLSGVVMRPRRWRCGVVVAMMCLGAMAKPMVVTLPIVCCCSMWALAPRHARVRRSAPVARAGSRKLPLAGVAGAVSLMTVAAQRAAARWRGSTYPLNVRVASALISWPCVEQTCWPVGLAAFYPLPPTAS